MAAIIETIEEAEHFVTNLKRSDNWVSNDELIAKLKASYDLIQTNEREDLIPITCVHIALYYIDLGEYGEAWHYTETAKLKAEEQKNYDSLLNAISLQYRIQLYLGNLEKSQEILIEQFNLALNYNDEFQLQSAYSNQAFQYHLLNQKEDCIYAFEQAIKHILKSKENYYISMTYINFAGYLIEFNEFEKAKENLLKGYNIALKYDFVKPLSISSANFGVLYFKQNNFKKAKTYYKKAIQYCEKQNNTIEAIQVKIMLADVLIKTDNFIKAESILKEVLDFSEQNNSKNNLNSIYLQLSDIYELKEDYKNSLTYFKKYKTVNEELYNNETSKRIKNLEIIQKTNLLTIERNNAQRMASIKHDFLANMSHEIRTPINSILGICYLMQQQSLNDIQKNYIERLRLSGETLLGIINDVLDISKIESGKMELYEESFSLNTIVSNAFNSLEVKANEKKIDFILKKKYNEDILLKGDAIRLQQALLNLLSNAVKFTQQGKVIIKIEVEEAIQQNIIKFTITDTGIGISKNNIDRIFERYEQADSNIKKKFGGTGLGLTITKKIIELMNGSIDIKSKINKGTEFIIQIPFATSQKNKLPKQINILDSKELNNKTILIADDNIENRLVAKEILLNFNKSIHFYEAENGQETLDILQEHKVDILFIDLDMPILNGIETIQKIKQDKKLEYLKIIGNTASLLSLSKEELSELGFDEFIYKPYKSEKLLEYMTNTKKWKE